MAARIHLILPAHLSMSPRGQREATVLQEAGHQVSLAGVWFDPARTEIDRELARRLQLDFRPVADLRPGRWKRWPERLGGRVAREVFRHTGRFSPALLGYAVRAQLETARRLKADLTIAHGEGGLWAAASLQAENRRVGVDLEDWFSCDLPPEQQLSRPKRKLARLEHLLLREGRYRVASSSAMANAVASAWPVTPLAVVTNAGVAPILTNPVHRPCGPLRLVWFSQTIGPARGLELLAAALPLVRRPVRVELRGAGHDAYGRRLRQSLPPGFRDRLVPAGPVPPWDLPGWVAQHDVGLSLETPAITSRDLCLPNKFFHYLAAGLAVIASSTQGHREALSPCPEAGLLLSENSSPELAAAIDQLAGDRDRLGAARMAARTAAKTCWSGERERSVILAEAARALDSAPRPARELLPAF